MLILLAENSAAEFGFEKFFFFFVLLRHSFLTFSFMNKSDKPSRNISFMLFILLLFSTSLDFR